MTVSKFFRAGEIPDWAIVHVGCDRRETPEQFQQRLARWQAEQAVALRDSHVGERGTVKETSETTPARSGSPSGLCAALDTSIPTSGQIDRL